MSGKTTVQICLNGSPVDTSDGQGGTIKAWEYDFHEFTEAAPDTDAIKAAPEKYLDYEPEKEPTAEEKIEKALANSEYAILLAGGDTE
ncbi:MAG: hypothetical protein ACI4W2_07860 [Eubacterium sp.]